MNRYEVQERLIGKEGQNQLRSSHVVIVGCGALGIPIALYSASAGIGKITLIDGDRVALENLHRQPLYTEAHIGEPKVKILKTHLEQLNASVTVEAHFTFLTGETITELIAPPCILVDAGDNFELTYLLNDYAYENALPLVYGAIYQYQGVVATFCATSQKLNYRDLFDSVDPSLCNCTEAGVLGPTAGIIGSVMAQEILSLSLSGTSPLSDRLLFYDAQKGSFQLISYKPNPENPLRKGHISSLSVGSFEVSWTDYFQQQENGVLVDLRHKEEREAFQIAETMWIPFPAVELEWIAEANPNQKFFCFCETGSRSAWVVRVLREKGISNVYSIKGGVQSFQKSKKEALMRGFAHSLSDE